MRTSFLESGQFYTRPQARSIPGTTKPKLASLLHANHWRRETPHKDPKEWLAAELVLRCHKVQERFPGAPAWAMIRKQAQSGCWLWPHQLLDGSYLALTKQKQQANQHPNARYVSHKTTILRRNSRFIGIFSEVSQLAKIRAARKTRENKILLYKRLRTLSEAWPQRMLLRNESKGTIPPSTQFASKQEIPASYNSKVS